MKAKLGAILTTVLVAAVTVAGPSNAQTSRQEFKTFQEWCENANSIDPSARKTVEALLAKTETKRCDVAQGQLTNRKSLDFRETPVSDLRPISGLTNLELLVLWGTPVSNLRPISGLTNLEFLFLTGTPVSDLKPISGLTNLKTLNLVGTPVSDLKPISG